MSADFARMAFPGESAEYRTARNALLDAEMSLRRQTEAVAALRRALPPGGALPEDYAFERIGTHSRPETVRLSELFGASGSLLLYSYMFGPERDVPCPGCTHLLDGVDGAARHMPQRAPLYVVSRSPIARLVAWANERGWAHLQFLSDESGAYTAAYYGNTRGLTTAMRAERDYAQGKDWDEPMLNVFRKDGDTVRHFWGSELVFAPEEPGQHHRALDTIDPLWNLLDTLPEGRGEDWFPKVAYSE